MPTCVVVVESMIAPDGTVNVVLCGQPATVHAVKSNQDLCAACAAKVNYGALIQLPPS